MYSCGDAKGFTPYLQCFFGVDVTHYFLVGAGLPCCQLEVLPSQDEEQEEGQHEELAVPHRHQEDLRRQRNKISNGLKHSLDQPR